MSEPLAFETIQKFRERVAQGNLDDNIKIVYRVAGGMPHEEVNEEFSLSGSGTGKIMVQDVLRSMPFQQISLELDHADVEVLFQQIGLGLDSLIRRSEASFLPDSSVGSITIEVNGERETLYFLADEEQRLGQNKPIAPQMTEAIQRIRGISKRLLKKDEDETSSE